MDLTVKICGVKTAEALDAALNAGADMVGLNFFPPSPRYIEPAAAALLAARARGRAAVVAVSVDADDAVLDAIVSSVRPDLLQLHGAETPERVAAIRERFRTPVMKAIGVREPSDLEAIDRYRGLADRLLIDAKPPKGAMLPGGNGLAFDWSILSALDPAVAYFLSGGLEPANVATAIAAARPEGIDVSSGVERAPGEKDRALIAAFIAAARRAAALQDPQPARSAAAG